MQVPVTPLYEGQGDFLSVQKETIVKRSTISFKQFNRRHSIRSSSFFLGLAIASILVVFSLAVPALSAHAATTAPARTTTPRTADTSVRCSGVFQNNGATGNHAWNYTANGDPNDGCNSKAWEAVTATPANADYHMGSITSAANYELDAYIPSNASAYMNYDIYQGTTMSTSLAFNQTQHGWQVIGNFTVTMIGAGLTIHERTGQVTGGLVMAHAAIRLVFKGRPSNPHAPAWRAEGQPYIHISSSYEASVDSKMDSDPSISDADKASIHGAADGYNAQSLAEREYQGPGSHSSTSSTTRSIVPSASGTFQSYTLIQWWGYQTFLNEQDTLQLDFDLKAGVAGAALITAICAGTLALATGLTGVVPCVAIGGIVVAALAFDSAVLEAINNSCGNIGIQVDSTGTNSAAWFYQIC